MSYPTPPTYLTWGGTIGDGAGEDVWQTGVHIGELASAAQMGLPSSAVLQELYDNALAPFHSSIDTAISSGAHLRWAKVARLSVSGDYTAEPSTYDGGDTPGAVSTARGGPQQTTVMGLWSGLTLGRANYGRLYLPWSGAAVATANARIATGVCDAIAAAGAALIDQINTWADSITAGQEVLIYSKVGAGTKKRPYAVRVGNVMDTQRRRRNKIVESYSAVVL